MDTLELASLRDPEWGIPAAIQALRPLAGRPLSGQALRYWLLLTDDLVDFLSAAGQITDEPRHRRGAPSPQKGRPPDGR